MGFFEKIKAGLKKTRTQLGGAFASFTGVNDEFFEELEELMILADIGVETSEDVIEQLRKRAREENLRGGEEIRAAVVDILADRMAAGVGKTTTIGKLAGQLRQEGKKVLLSAADTFRAAAADQLAIWAQRAGADIVRHEENSDPASVVYDSIAAAKARGTDVIIVDTAGRLHNKSNLMNELNKISRVIDRELPGADRETLLVLDATTGQNGLIQAREFREAAGLTGIVLTKLDGTAKGGIAVAIADQLKLPVKYVGVGEQADDLIRFNGKEFVEALFE